MDPPEDFRTLNPFAPPAHPEPGASDDWSDLDPQMVRDKLHFWETNVSSLGGMLILFSFFPLLIWLFGAPPWVVAAFSLFSVVTLWVGYGLLMLRPWSRFPAILTSVLLVAYIPLGTVLGLIGLVLLFCQGARQVLTEEYAAIMELTTPSPTTWRPLLTALGLLLVLAAAALLMIG